MTVLRRLRRLALKMWARVVLMGLLAIVAVGLGQVIEPLVPEKIAQSVAGSSVDRLLQLIASAMLAVTIFSITVMVSVHQSSSTQWTPRVHRLIMQDRTTQNTMAVFIGAYVYALFGIILRELGIYTDERAFVVFWMTVFVLAAIVVYLIRWVLHLQGFGQLGDTSRQVEEVTRAQFKDRLARPCLGGGAPSRVIFLTVQSLCQRGKVAICARSTPKRSMRRPRISIFAFICPIPSAVLSR